MAEGAAGRGARRGGPAPIASFDHDYSDESSPETKQTFRLPEIREHPAGGGESLSVGGEGRARSHSTPAVGALPAPAPRIDISRASSSSHHDSRDSSPELALFAGDTSDPKGQRLELGFREDGALDLRSSTEELSFLEPAPGEPRPAPTVAPPAPPPAPAPPPPATDRERRHSRKDSQSSEVALLGVSGRTSRLSSVGSACSAQSAVSRLSVASGAARSPSPHRMLLETSFCGPKPIETDPEACAAAVAEHILEIAKMTSPPPAVAAVAAVAVDARDRREVCTEVTVEAAPAAPAGTAPAASAVPRVTRQPALALSPVMAPAPKVREPDKSDKESKNYARTEDRKARPRVRREPSEPEVYKTRNQSKDIIRIKLRPDDDDDEEESSAARKPVSLALGAPAAPAPKPPSPAPSRRRSPSPLGPPSVSRKSSFCSLFKSRETIGSPESPSAQEALRRKRSLTEGRARSKSRDRSATPTSTSTSAKIRGSVLSLFRTPRKSAAAAGSTPGSRATSPAPAHCPPAPADPRRAHQDKLKYYEEAKNGVIHIPLRTPPEERGAGGSARRGSGASEPSRPASAPQPRAPAPLPDPRPASATAKRAPPMLRTVLPDGSIIIPLHSPTDRIAPSFPEATPADPPPELRPTGTRGEAENASRVESAATSLSSPEAVPEPPETCPQDPEPAASPPDHHLPEVTSKRRKERLVFTTHVGSREQVFSTQFSITKTPSITSEVSGELPTFENGELRDTHITADPSPAAGDAPPAPAAPPAPHDPPRDSSESEHSSEAPLPPAGNDVEKRGLVVQESFEEELPFVPTTLPQERSVAVPMVPVRERGGGERPRGLQRPRAPPPPNAWMPDASVVAPPPATWLSDVGTTPPSAPTPSDKMRIKLPRRPRVSSTTSAPPRPSRERTRSGSGGNSGGEGGAKPEWIDFEEVPERRKQPRRIQTLPAVEVDSDAAGGGRVFAYVEPKDCRCECHAHAHAHAHAHNDTHPLLDDDMNHSRISSSSAECGEEWVMGAEEQPSPGSRAAPCAPFTADLDLRHDAHAPTERTAEPRP